MFLNCYASFTLILLYFVLLLLLLETGWSVTVLVGCRPDGDGAAEVGELESAAARVEGQN